jgi:hypothetical protein
MEHFYHLVETNPVIDIGHVKVADDDGSFSVEKPNSFKGVLMLLTSEGRPVFEPNAFILNRRINEVSKTLNQRAFTC